MSAIDRVLGRLDNPKLTGPDRWRSRCPACGGSSTSALSLGIGDDDRVLFKCFKGCSADEVARAIGLDIADLFPDRPAPHGGFTAMRRRALLSARQAIDLLEVEFMLVWTAAFNLANGHALTPDDLDRLAVASRCIRAAIDEVRA